MTASDQLFQLGPWPGGLNLRDASYATDQVPNAQLRALLNLDVTDSGVLIPRRGVQRAGGGTMYTERGSTGFFQLLGTVDDASGARYAVVGVFDGGSPGVSYFHYSSAPYSQANADWPATATTTSQPSRFSAVVQYNSRIYFVPNPSGTGQGWYRTSLSTGGYTAVAAMPKGHLAFMVRDRMFVIDKSASNRVYYSKATDPATWSAPDGGSFDVNPGDGLSITAAVVINSQIYLFKKYRTYLFTFTSDPGLDGQLTLINDQVGALHAVPYENGVLLVGPRGVYRLVNNYFAQLDALMELGANFDLSTASSTGVFVTIEGDQLVVGPSFAAGTYNYAAMNLRTNAWSGRRYTDATTAPGTRSIVAQDAAGGESVLYGDSRQTLSATRLSPGSARATYALDLSGSSVLISPEYSLATGELDFGSYFHTKGLSWAAARLRAALPDGDTPVRMRVWEGPEMTSAVQEVTIPKVADGAKVPLSRRTNRSVSIGLFKPRMTLDGQLVGNLTTPLTARSGMVFHGVHPETASGGIASFETAAGKKAAVEGYYLNWADNPTFDAVRAEAVHDAGRVNLISWGPSAASGGVTQPAYSHAAIIAGGQDTLINAWADGIRAWGRPLFLRPMYEMNGNWFPWGVGVNGNTAASFIEAWRYIWGVFVARGCHNVTWVWSPNRTNVSYASYASVYPGTDYVDWAGLDAYNGLPLGTFETPTSVFNTSLTELLAAAPGKPVMISETASAEAAGDKAGWITSYFSALAGAYSYIKGFLWFNYDKEAPWLIQSSAPATAAYAAGVADSRYASRPLDAFESASDLWIRSVELQVNRHDASVRA